MRPYDFQFVSDDGRITYISASCRKEAIELYCDDKGVNNEYVKQHCVVRNMGGTDVDKRNKENA